MDAHRTRPDRWYSAVRAASPAWLRSTWLRLRATATKLGTRVFVFVFFSVLAPVVLYSIVGNQALSMSNQRALDERLVMAKVVAANLDRAIQNAIGDLQQVASSSIDLEDADTSKEQAALANLFAHQWLFSYGVVIFDSAGNPIVREPQDLSLSPEPFINSVRIPLALKEDRPTVTAGRPSSPGGPFVLALSVPLHDRKGNAIAVLSGLVDLNKPTIRSLLDPLALGKTGQAEIIDDHGLVIASTVPGVSIEPSQHGPIFVSLIKGGETTVGTCHGCHEGQNERKDEGGRATTSDREVLAFAPLEIAPSGVVIRQGESETLAFSRWLQERLIVFGVGALIVALLLAHLTTRGVLAPIRALSEACVRMGAGDLSVGVKSTSSDEIGALADAFEKMRLKLQASLEEIQRWNRELEKRVRERTLELQQRNRELSALYTTSATLSQTLELDRVLREGLDTVLQLFDIEAGGIMTWNDEGTGLVFRVHHGFSPDFVEGVAGLASGEGISGRAAQTGQPVMVDDLSSDPLVTRSVARAEGIRSFVAIPLEANGKVFGVLNLGSRRQRPFAPEEVQLLTAVGHQIAVAINNAQLFEEAGKAQALREADRAKSELLSTVSHELRTPLAGIKAHATALLRPDVDRDQESVREYLHVVVEEADRLRLLIDNLLDMTRIESGAMHIDKRPVQIADLAEAVASSMRRHAEGCDLSVSFPPDFPVVEADHRRIEQVLRNLVDNAVKYSPRGGKVVISGVKQEGEVLVSVTDEGIGIRASDLDLIFERFHRVDSPAVRRAGGAGLGLAICRGIVEAHGGRIWAESTPGRGTTIRFTLPSSEALLVDALRNEEY